MKNFEKEYLSLSWPLIGQSLLHIVMQQIDLMMVAQLGTVSVASIGLVNAYFFVFFMFFIAMGFGVFSLMTQLHGDRKFKDLGKLTGSAVTVSFILGLLLWVIFTRGLEIFLVLWKVDSSVVEISRQYAKGLGPGLPFLACIVVLESALRSCGLTSEEFRLKILATLINILLNFILIFGFIGFPALGEFGAGLATSIARIFTVLILLHLLVSKAFELNFEWHWLLSFNQNLWKKVLQFSGILLFQDILWALAILAYSRAFSEMGTDVLAVYNVMYLMDCMADAFCMGFTWSAGIIIGRDLGKAKFNRVWVCSHVMLKICLKYSFIVIIGLAIISPLILFFYPFDSYQQGLYWGMFWIHGAIFPLKMIGMILMVGALRSGGDYMPAALIELGGMYLFSVPLALMAAIIWQFGPLTVFLILSSEWILKTILVWWRFNKKVWLRRLI